MEINTDQIRITVCYHMSKYGFSELLKELFKDEYPHIYVNADNYSINIYTETNIGGNDLGIPQVPHKKIIDKLSNFFNKTVTDVDGSFYTGINIYFDVSKIRDSILFMM